MIMWGVCKGRCKYTHTNIQTCRHTRTHAHTLTHTCTHTHSRTHTRVKGPIHLGTHPLTFPCPLPLFSLYLFPNIFCLFPSLFLSHVHALSSSLCLTLSSFSCLAVSLRVRKYTSIHQILTPNPTPSPLPYRCLSVSLYQGLKEHSDAPPYGDQLPCKCTQTHTPSLSLAHTHIYTITFKNIHIHALIHTNTHTHTHTHTHMNTLCKAPL